MCGGWRLSSLRTVLYGRPPPNQRSLSVPSAEKQKPWTAMKCQAYRYKWDGGTLGVEHSAGARSTAQTDRGGDGNANRHAQCHNVEAGTAKAAQSSAYSGPGRRNRHTTAQGAGTIGARTADWKQISVLGVKDVGADDRILGDKDGEANTLVVDIRERETSGMAGITRCHGVRTAWPGMAGRGTAWHGVARRGT